MKKKNKNKKLNKKVKKAKAKKKVSVKAKKSKSKFKTPTKKAERTGKKLSASERKAENLERLSSELIEKGRKRGFITYDEILKNFPDIENNILFLDELYEKFGVAGIDVLESGNLIDIDAAAKGDTLTK